MRDGLYRAPTKRGCEGFAPTLRLSRRDRQEERRWEVEPAALPPIGRRVRALAGASKVGTIDETEAVEAVTKP